MGVSERPETPSDLVDIRAYDEQRGREIGAALAHAVLPALAVEQLDGARRTALRSLALEPSMPKHVLLVPQAVRLDVLDVQEATIHLQAALLEERRRFVAAALWSVGKWMIQQHRGNASALPREITE